MLKIWSLPCVALLVLFTSCASTGSSTSKSSDTSAQTWVFDSPALENAQLEKGAISVKTAPGKTPVMVKGLKPFGKVVWFTSMMDMLGMNDSLTLDTKKQLLKELFTDVPAEPTADFFKAVAVGQCFNGGKPMVFYLETVKASSKAPAGTQLVYKLTGNFSLMRQKDTNAPVKMPIAEMIAGSINWYTLGILTKDGRLVRAGNIFSTEEENSIKKEGTPAAVKGNLIDLYVKDELLENDALIPSLASEALADPSADDSTKALIHLNMILYYLSLDQVDKAEESLKKAINQGKNISEPSFRQAIEKEAPETIALYKSLSL